MMKVSRYTKHIPISLELIQDGDPKWETHAIKLPGIKNAIRRFFKRGGYEYECLYNPDAPDLIDYLSMSIGEGFGLKE